MLVVPKNDRHRHHRTRLRPRRPSRRRRPACDGERRQVGTGRQIRQGLAGRRSASGPRRRDESCRPTTCVPPSRSSHKGEVPAGIVYATDANAEPKVKVIGTFPADSHPPIVYPACADRRVDEPGCEGVPRLPEVGRRQARVHGAGLHRSRAGELTRGPSIGPRFNWNHVRRADPSGMGRDPALSFRVATVAALASLPCGHSDRVAAGARALPRPMRWSTHSSTLPLVMPPVVDRLPAAPHLRPARTDRRRCSTRRSASCSRSTGPARRWPAAIMGFPLMVRAIRLSIEAIDRGSKRPRRRSAPGDRSSSRRSHCRSPCPASSPVSCCRFARALGEFGATITFVGNIPGVTQTDPVGDLHLHAGAGRRHLRRCG